MLSTENDLSRFPAITSIRILGGTSTVGAVLQQGNHAKKLIDGV